MAGGKTQSARLIVFLGLLACSLFAQAFNADGHRLVVQLAQYRLDDNARGELSRLYGEQWQRELIRLADWAHEEKPEPVWRTVLFDADQTGFDPARQCPNNRCVVGAVLESQYVLTNPSFSQEAKREAVQYLMHFMADLHIPINAGLRQDRAGRDISLLTSNLRRIDLHHVWNEQLFQEIEETWFTRAQRYRRRLDEADAQRWIQPLSPVEWALESNRLAVEVAYPLAERGQYDAIYVHRALPVLEEQLMKAGVRLAGLLNAAFTANEK